MKVPLDLYEEPLEVQISAQIMHEMLENSSRTIYKVSVISKQTNGLKFSSFVRA